MRRSHTITDWDPENLDQWRGGGEKVAKRNLLWSVVAEHVGFSVWSLWSVMVLFMPESVYGITAADKFLIAATATLVGSCLRLPYTLATARFGGRNWTVFSAFVLAVPVIATIVILANPGQPLWVYLLCAALTGFGGGNFASSMTNINAFFPQRLKGWALGLNAGGGNIGVPAVQLVGLLVIAVAGDQQPYWVCAVYLVLLAVAGIGAALFMDNLDIPTVDVAAMRAAAKHRQTWIIALLYIGTFGSFIGFSFAFGQVMATSYRAAGQSPAEASLHAAQIAFLGPLLGSLARVYGGKLADRFGGGRVTMLVFAGMVVGAGVLIGADLSTSGGAPSGAVLIGYFTGFILLFLLSGLGNGSVYKMIPSIFEAEARGMDTDEATRVHYSRAMSGAVIGIAGAIGGLGGVGINLVLRTSYQATGAATVAFCVFGTAYVLAAALTWWMYVRVPGGPSTVSTPRARRDTLVGVTSANRVPALGNG
ncbi:nitrate/nitrite transporter [Mycolicibacterium brumae]|uniref:NarK/NasA family nitrate transporter n=1 Tax=Mycolicibacterium brumae TaxID=85968 RepID=A0A2G5PAM8_9MYCO|nr:nitrate/nitrite transporter [Mycolicibacterium brumae]MCV7193060.1 NarK/NasA family nitrate transporter [Mycolicibacterium brumae]PIB75376.1 NarK/NasA family nitrate transporter [Mycolicibacterium brumae]RWA22015.1 major facilitator transporter [Mycolicibacterium brumae DSM 44177]UWW07938.1 NarK/NasA family nitrate transporter [Mycolicibacterium brumae]